MEWPNPDEKGNQSRFAFFIGTEQSNISRLVRNGILKKEATNREWLAAYLKNLREKAAGRSDNKNLTDARIADTLAAAELKKLQLAERAGQLVEVAAIEPAWRDWAAVGRRSIQNAGERIKEALESRLKAAGVEFDLGIEIVEKPLADALRDIERYPAVSTPDAFAGGEGMDSEGASADDTVGGG